MDGYEINRLVDEHFYIGSEELRSYKKIIQRSAYPPFNHSVDLEVAKEAVNAYAKSGGSLENVVELTVFFLECGTHFSGDFGGDMGEEFYEVLENTFEELLNKLKSQDNKNLLNKFVPRIKAIIETAHESGYGYDGQLEDYWQDAFGTKLEG